MVALEGNRLRVLDRGEVRVDQDLPQEVLRGVVNVVTALKNIRPRRSYGQGSYASDLITTELSIHDDSTGLDVEVVSDPSDPAPAQFWDVVNGLRKLTKLSTQAKVGER